ncbi:hypothetical protein HDV00_001369 [Rhizophlyctis rosea]|nr:hypothetical protein HDV00_001369 [Rhizophlyctis rosea]
MATLTTFPDILILLFSLPNISVPNLLKSERVCKQWCTLIRNNQVQIWKSKLAAGFPEGCFPVRYGEENWRDVAVLWWAWRSLGSGGERVDLPVDTSGDAEVVKDGKGLSRRSDGVVRDLTNATSFLFAEYVRGVRPIGETVLSHSPSDSLSIDTVLKDAETVARPIQHLAPDINFKRSSFVGRKPPNNKTFYEIWASGDPSPTSLPHWEDNPKTICGSHLSVESTETQPSGDDNHHIRIFPLDRASSPIHICTGHEEYIRYAMNESILVYIPQDPPRDLLLVRLTTKQRIASCHLPHVPLDAGVELTRFNVFYWNLDVYWVCDLKLNLLYQFPNHMAIPSNPKMTWYPWEAADWTVIHYVFNGPKDRLVVLDPKMRRYRLLSTAYPPNEPRGYLFTTIEYPIDDEGKRTGAGGVNRYYWRSAEMVKAGMEK